MKQVMIGVLGKPSQSVVVDVALTEEHTFEADVTEYPIESGASITDNVRPKPITVTLDCIVSDSPIGDIELARDVDSDGLPTETAYARLRKMFAARETVSVVTSLDVFESMLIKSISIPRSKDDGVGGLHFTIALQQAIIVTNDRTIVRVAIPIGAKKANLGHKNGIKRDELGNVADPAVRNARWKEAKEAGAVPIRYIKGPDGKTAIVPVDPNVYDPWWSKLPDKDPEDVPNPGDSAKFVKE